MMDHPAVIVARRNARAAAERIAQPDLAETHASIR
jgi:hypothetical protein